MEISKQDILDAHERISGYINKTPVLTSSFFDKQIGAELFFKCENFQKVGAFKSRGAVNAVFSLDENQIHNGVCTHSSGNHAQALARAATLRGIKSYIVMPDNSPKVKVEAVKAYGGEITFCEPILSSRESTLKKIMEKTGATEIHPYNDYNVIAGQSTACKELLEECSDLDFIIAPLGGGGLLSGTLLSAHFFGNNSKVIGAEPENAKDAFLSLKEGKILPPFSPNSIADGLLTSLGDKTFPIIQKYVDRILTCPEDSILPVLKMVYERMKIIIEPSSAVALAVILLNPEIFRGKRVGVIFSGGNVDLSKIRF